MKALAKKLLAVWESSRNETRFAHEFSRLIPDLHKVATEGDEVLAEAPPEELPSERANTQATPKKRARKRPPARQWEGGDR